ncbi:MAG: putative quinol monooxygenase [Actinomycetota bacterium]
MAIVGQTFTAGEWRVKEGKEQEFIEAWDSFAAWCQENGWGGEPPYLLQSQNDHARFLSFGAWENEEQVVAWRQLPQFQEFLARARELCEEIQPGSFRLAAHPAG